MYAYSYFMNGKEQRNASKRTWLVRRRAGTLYKSIALWVGGEHQDVWNLLLNAAFLDCVLLCTEANSISGPYHVCLMSSCLST